MSLLKRSWKYYSPTPGLDIVAQILKNRGIDTPEKISAFLDPHIKHLSDPMEIPDIKKACQRVLEAKAKGEKVVVFGDYDVDGVTGTAILINVLRFVGIDCAYYIPSRYGEGYSLSLDAVKSIAQQNVKLIITVDCGISSSDEIKEANLLGIDVIVTDHHNPPKNLPPAYALVNPKLIKEEHPSKHLSGAGVAFKFAWALLRCAGIKDSRFLTEMLDLVALGTIADIVPLTEENRILAICGLNYINQRKRLGIRHLIEAASIKGEVTINNIYFALAPRINAAGRLEHASKSVDLLLAEDEAKARELALELCRINVRRQGIGASIQDEVFSKINEDQIENIIVLSGEDWHPGVIGIVASRITDRYYRPSVLIGTFDGVGRGSARSIEGFDLFSLLETCRDLFIDFGGHERAAGFEIKTENIPELKKRLEKTAKETISEAILKPNLLIDVDVDPSDLTLSLVESLKKLSPHGEANPQPVFSSKNLRVKGKRLVGKDNAHLKLNLTDGQTDLEAIGFRLGALADRLSFDTLYDVAYIPESNEWNGFDKVQLNLVDIKEASG